MEPVFDIDDLVLSSNAECRGHGAPLLSVRQKAASEATALTSCGQLAFIRSPRGMATGNLTL